MAVLLLLMILKLKLFSMASLISHLQKYSLPLISLAYILDARTQFGCIFVSVSCFWFLDLQGVMSIPASMTVTAPFAFFLFAMITNLWQFDWPTAAPDVMLWMTVYAKGVSVLMPGDDVPTFLAHPAPAPCRPERIIQPLQQHSRCLSYTSTSSSS
ncbi:hypothetical protein D5086_033767 [Populus alba]|uniref:Uncharacterized protein n=1 Tax=Populus alba TaxID=43335 RepID=A0ACC4AHT5_POPAL